MGWNTRWITQSLHKARKAGKEAEAQRVEKLLLEAQARCNHSGPHASTRMKEDSKNGKYKTGGTIHWCHLCGDKTGYDPPPGP